MQRTTLCTFTMTSIAALPSFSNLALKSALHLPVAACFLFMVVLSGCGGSSTPSSPPPALTIATLSVSSGTWQTPYTETIQASGGVAPFSWTVNTGALPHNLSLSDSATNVVTISGTPDTPTTGAAFTIKVTDSAGQVATNRH